MSTTPVTPMLVLRLLLALGLFIGLDYFVGKTLTQTLLPLFHWELSHINATYSILDLRLDRVGGDSVIALDAGLAQSFYLGGHLILSDSSARATITTLTGFVIQPVVICMALVFSWPGSQVKECALRVAIACALLVLVILLDVPFVLWGELWDIHVSTFEPDLFSPLLVWKNFLQSGGRYSLGLVAGYIAIAIPQKIEN